MAGNPWWLAGRVRPLCAGWQCCGRWFEYQGGPTHSTFTARPAPGLQVAPALRPTFSPLVVWHRNLTNEEVVRAAQALEAGDYQALLDLEPDIFSSFATFEEGMAALEGCDEVEIL